MLAACAQLNSVAMGMLGGLGPQLYGLLGMVMTMPMYTAAQKAEACAVAFAFMGAGLPPESRCSGRLNASSLCLSVPCRDNNCQFSWIASFARYLLLLAANSLHRRPILCIR